MKEVIQDSGEIWFYLPPCGDPCFKRDANRVYIKGTACELFDAQSKSCEANGCKT